MSNNLGFIDPTAGGGVAPIPLARRRMDLAGATVGLLDNTKEQGDVILQTLGEALQARYGVARVVLRRKEHYSKPAAEAIIAAMAQEVDVAIAAVGGWGSCTLCCVHDTIAFEQRDIPAAVIITRAFTRAAEFQFRAKGMPGHPSVVLPHPISNLTTADMQALTQRYVEQVVRHLTA